MAERESNMPEMEVTPQPASEGSQLQQLVRQRVDLIRNLRGNQDPAAREPLNQVEAAIDRFLVEASENGMLAGLDLELDDAFRGITDKNDPGDRRKEARRVRRDLVSERFEQLEERFKARYSDDDIEKYAGAQRIYLERGLETIERMVNGEGGTATENMWQWTIEGYSQRRLEDELEARRNTEGSKNEDRERGRKATIEEFVRLKNLTRSGEAIGQYIQARYLTDVDSYPEDQRASIIQGLQTRINNTPPKLRQIGDEAWRNFQAVDSLRAYVKAKKDLENLANVPDDQLVQVQQEAQNILLQTPDDQKRIAEEILQKRDQIPTTPEGFIENILDREGIRLFRLATKVIMQEETIGVDKRNYVQLHEAYNYVEKVMPEALIKGTLEGLRDDMGNLYKDYKQRIIDGKIQPGYRADLEDLRNRAMAEEKGWWDDHMRSNNFTEVFRSRFEGARAFYTYRAFQRLLQLIENKDQIRVILADQETLDRYISDTDDVEREQGGLLDNFNTQQERLDTLLESGQINQDQFNAAVQQIETAYLRGVDSLGLRRINAIGEWTPIGAERYMRGLIEEQEKRKLEANSFWDRQWGTVVLRGETREQVIKGVDDFLETATSDETNFDAQRYIEDGSRLGQEILRVGRHVGMDIGELNELVARAEGTLFINVARYFATHWHVAEWHQVASMVGRHINSRLKAVSKAYDAEVMHADYLLETEEDGITYARPAKYDRDESSRDNEVAGNDRIQAQLRLERRIALSRLKSINEIIRENITPIEGEITSLGFNPDSLDLRDLFELPAYLDAVKNARAKLNHPDQLTDVEKQLLILDRIRPYGDARSLVTIDQTDEQFRSLFEEYGGFGTKEAYGIEIQRLDQKKANNENLDEKEERFWDREQLLVKAEKRQKLTKEESRAFPEIAKAQQAVDLAIKTRDVFFISAEKACASVKTRMQLPETDTNRGELLSFNDVIRFNKFVRERAIASLPGDIGKELVVLTSDGQGFRYVEIADKLEFRKIAQETINQAQLDKAKPEDDPTRRVKKGAEDNYIKNSAAALPLITFTTEEQKYQSYVQAVENVQEEALKKLRELGSSITVTDVDAIIEQALTANGIRDIGDVASIRKQAFSENGVRTGVDIGTEDQLRVAQLTYSVHNGEAKVEETVTYQDIVSREDADPQYNYSMMDDSKYRSLLLSKEVRDAAYDPEHPDFYTIPAGIRRALDPDGTRLTSKEDPIDEKVAAYRVMEYQRRSHFAVDSVKAFGAFYRTDPYGVKEVEDDIVKNITNSPFIARRAIEQRTWATWEKGMAYRGRGFLKYHDPNIRGLDHAVGRAGKGLRGIIAAYTGYNNDQNLNFSGVLDELTAEIWLNQVKEADVLRTVLQGGQIGDKPFDGLFKKVLSTPGRVNEDFKTTSLASDPKEGSVFARMIDNQMNNIYGGDFEVAVIETTKILERLIIYGKSYGFVGRLTQIPKAAKFTGDTAAKRMEYWAIAHPEAIDMYQVNMDIVRTALQPLVRKNLGDYFGPGGTIFSEVLRREILVN